jgi:hypothetical protein
VWLDIFWRSKERDDRPLRELDNWSRIQENKIIKQIWKCL